MLCHPLESHSSGSQRITWNSTALYPPPPRGGENIPMSVTPYHIDNSVPTEKEVKWAVRRLQRHRLGGGLPDARQASLGVSVGASGVRSGSGSGSDVRTRGEGERGRRRGRGREGGGGLSGRWWWIECRRPSSTESSRRR